MGDLGYDKSFKICANCGKRVKNVNFIVFQQYFCCDECRRNYYKKNKVVFK